MNGYANLKVLPEDADKIASAMKPLGFKTIPPDELHVTLMYDRRNPDIKVKVPDHVYTAKVTGVAHMGEKGSKWEAVTLKLSCPELSGRFLALQAMGFKHSYPSFKPHVSLMYGNVDKAIPAIEALMRSGKFPKEIRLYQETWSPLKDD